MFKNIFPKNLNQDGQTILEFYGKVEFWSNNPFWLGTF